MSFFSPTGDTLAIRKAAKSSGFSGAATLAKLIEGESAPGPLTEALKTQPSLTEAYASLSDRQRGQIQKKLGERHLEEILSLSKEKDARVFFHNFLNLGMRFEDQERLDLASMTYALLGEGAGISEQVQRLAKLRFDAISGRGAAGYRIAFLAERISEQSISAHAIFSMGVAGGVFKVARLGFMSRLAGSAFAKPLANTLAFGVETMAFTTASKLSSAALGVEQNWGADAWLHEWLSGGSMLAGLKLTGAFSSYLAKNFAKGPGLFERFTQVAMPQVGMFGGIILGNKFATLGGFKPKTEGDTWLIDAFSTLIEFNVSGHLAKQAFGKGFARFEGEVEATTEMLAKHRNSNIGPSKWAELFSEWMGPNPGYAMATLGGNAGHAAWIQVGRSDQRPGFDPEPMQMSMLDPSGVVGAGKAGTYVPSARPQAADRAVSIELNQAVELYLKGIDRTNPEHLQSLDLIQANAEAVRDSLIGRDFRHLDAKGWDRLAELLTPPDFQIVTKPEMKRVLINNRGEIAVRLSRGMVEEGLTPVVLVPEIEQNSSWVNKAKELGAEIRVVTYAEAETALWHKASPQELYKFTYQNIERVVADALALKADAVHPGYGYISENAEFAKRLFESDIALVGPSHKTMEEAGDKDVAKRNFIKAGVPVALGTEKGYLDVNDLIAEVRQLGLKYPLRLKAVGGGGGRGQATVYSEAELRAVFDKKKAEAESAFNNGHLMAEVFVPSFHHIEFQIMADRFGNTVIVGERECTLQVGDQKLIEIHPAEIFNRIPGLKEKMYESANKAAKSVNYTGHGTVEFMVNPETGDFYALEVNARIQVEHRVSELVSGVDLIREAVRVSKGLPLSFRQEDVKLKGAAIEIRIKGAKPTRRWDEAKQRWEVEDKPRPGVITKFEVPNWEGVYVESSVDVGDQVSPYADPMIAKILVTGKDRAHALQRAIHVLEATKLEGAQGFESDIQRQLALLKTEAVRKAYYDNNTVKNWSIQAREGDKKTLHYWEDRSSFANQEAKFVTKDGDFTALSLEVVSGAKLEPGVSGEIEAALTRLVTRTESAESLKLKGPIAELLRKDDVLGETILRPQNLSPGKYWMQVNESGEIRQLLYFENNRPLRALFSRQVPVNLSKEQNTPLSREMLYDVHFNQKGNAVDSARLHLYGEDGLFLLGSHDKTDKGPFFTQLPGSDEVGLFMVPSRSEAGKGSKATESTARTLVPPAAVTLKFIPTRLMTGLEIRSPQGDVFVSMSPEKIMERPDQRLIALIALADSKAPEDIRSRAAQQVSTLVQQLSNLGEQDPIRTGVIEELGSTPNSLISRLLVMLGEARPLNERQFLGEILARREIEGFSQAHELTKYEFLTPILPATNGMKNDPPPSLALYTEKTPEGYVLPHAMIRSRAFATLNIIHTMQEAVAQLRHVEKTHPELRDNAIQVVVERPKSMMLDDEVFSEYLSENLKLALAEDAKTAPETNDGKAKEPLRLGKVTVLVARRGEYPDYFQFEPVRAADGIPTGEFVENIRERHLPDILYNLMEIWRHDNFDLWRDLDFSDRSLHLYYGIAKGQASDQRLFGSSMVPEALAVRDREGKLLEIPEIEAGFVNLAEAMQGSLKAWAARAEAAKAENHKPVESQRPAAMSAEALAPETASVKGALETKGVSKAPNGASSESPQYNRMFINVSPVMEVTDAEAMDYAVRLAERHFKVLRDLHLEKVVVKARLKDDRLPERYRTVLVRITNPTGYQYEPVLHNVVRAKVATKAGAIETREVLINNGAFARWLEHPQAVIPATEWFPADIPIKPMTPLEAREKSIQVKGGTFAYRKPQLLGRRAEEFLKRNGLVVEGPRLDSLLPPPLHDPSFEELDLDPKSTRQAKDGSGKETNQLDANYGELIPAVDAQGQPRPIGQNKAGIVIGIKTMDLQLDQPVQVMALMGDLSYESPKGKDKKDIAASKGSLGPEESARINAALLKAKDMGIPVVWFPASAGAEIHEERGVTGLDATATTARELVHARRIARGRMLEMAKLAKSYGVPIHIVVDDVNIGAQSYWNSLATIIHDTGGILVMTKRGTMGLTGHVALGGVFFGKLYGDALKAKAKELFKAREHSLSGYKLIHGPNGEAMAYAEDLSLGMDALVDHLFNSYAKPGEIVAKRPLGEHDPANRDITTVRVDSQAPGTVGDEINKILKGQGTKNPLAILNALRDVGSLPPRVWWYDVKAPVRAEVEKDGFPDQVASTLVADIQLGGRPTRIIFQQRGLSPKDSDIIARAIRKADNAGMPIKIMGSFPGFEALPEAMRKEQLRLGGEIANAISEAEVPIDIIDMGYLVGGVYVVFSKQERPVEKQGLHSLIAVQGAKAQVIGGGSASKVVFAGRIGRYAESLLEKIQESAPFQEAKDDKSLPPFQKFHELVLNGVTERMNGELKNLEKIFDKYPGFEDYKTDMLKKVKGQMEGVLEDFRKKLPTLKHSGEFKPLIEETAQGFAALSFDAVHTVDWAVKVGSFDEVVTPAQLREAMIRRQEAGVEEFYQVKQRETESVKKKVTEFGLELMLGNPESFAEAFHRLAQREGWSFKEARAKLGPYLNVIQGMMDAMQGPGSSGPKGGSGDPEGTPSTSASSSDKDKLPP